MIKDVRTKPLRVIPDERGRLMETLRCDDDLFIKFGQAYVTTAYPGVVKGWHYHKIQVDHFVALRGMFKVVLYDGREDSSTHGEVNEFFMGVHNPVLLQIPRLVLHGFKGIADEESMMLNIPSEPYNYDSPDEYRVDPHDESIPYDWTRVDR
jgi:dTDP-4-dehydrorhamnose 3,5-epimerase